MFGDCLERPEQDTGHNYRRWRSRDLDVAAADLDRRHANDETKLGKGGFVLMGQKPVPAAFALAGK